MPGGRTPPQDVGWLGADAEKRKNSSVAVFIPSRTKHDDAIDHEYWRDEAVVVMSELFGGVTSISDFGGWLDEEEGRVKKESISIMVSFIAEEEWHRENVLKLKDFLYRMGREAQQGAVGLYVNGRYLEIPSEKYEQEA